MARRRYRNDSEQALVDMLRARGIEPWKGGWPDFWWMEDGELYVAEVKGSPYYSLKRHQRQVMSMLIENGVKCFFFSPQEGFEEIDLDSDRLRKRRWNR